MSSYRALVVGVVVALFAASAFGTETTIPPKPTRWVTDTAGLMTPAAGAALDARLSAYEKKTGHQIVVWIADSIGQSPLDDFAVRTFKAWQLGQRGRDDGILVAVLARDHKIALEVGYGLEDRVPDAAAGRIIDDVMAPRLRAGDADGALQSGIDALTKAIDGQSAATSEPRAASPPAAHPSAARHVLFAVLALLFLILMVTNPSLAMYLLFSIFNGGGGFGGGGGGGGFSGGGGRSGGGGARGSW